MLTTKEAIEKRRSIRKFKSDAIPDEYINELLNAARLAPSGSNAQPWRFKIVKDEETKLKLAHAAHNQLFITKAPVVIVCCADIKGFLDGTVSSAQDLGRIGALEDRIVKILIDRAGRMKSYTIDEMGAWLAVNVAIAIEHMVLRALDFELGTCWMRLIDAEMIRNIFGWDDKMLSCCLIGGRFPGRKPHAQKEVPN